MHQARSLKMESELAWCETEKLGVKILNESDFIKIIK